MKKTLGFTISFLAVILTAFFYSQSLVLGVENLEQLCAWDNIENSESLLDKNSYQALLEKCKVYYEERSNAIENDINQTEQEKKNLKNQIYLLQSKMQKLDYQIRQGNIMVKDLTTQIKGTEGSIEQTGDNIEQIKQKLVLLLQLKYQSDQMSAIEILLAENKFSDFFSEMVGLERLNEKTQDLLKNIKDLKVSLEDQKQAMDSEKTDLEKLVILQSIQKKDSDAQRKQRESLLKLTEAEYQAQLKEKQETEKRVVAIKARIFELAGVTKAPTFGEAYEMAKYVADITGIRPAFLLAILQQESSIGKNVGQCYLYNEATGSGIKIATGKTIAKVMSPRRDVSPFLVITKDLGRDPFQTPVSCPLSVGWGGAMGPAQFIPSTWILYKSRLEGIIGRPADPWNIKDAFLASGLYLTDYGAKSQTRSGEWKAAMVYFSGSTTNKAFYWYADNVLKTADGFADDIADIENNR